VGEEKEAKTAAFFDVRVTNVPDHEPERRTFPMIQYRPQIGRFLSSLCMAEPASAPPAPAATTRPEFDIQHDDEFEDFQVKSGVVSDADKARGADLLDDWDDDVLEDFSVILQEQRSRFG
jgi:hypothetical protein